MTKLFISKTYYSKIGPISVVSSKKGLQQIIIGSDTLPLFDSGDPFNAIIQIQRYFEGSLKEFNLPIDIVVSDFTKKVLDEIMKLPFGKTSTYKAVAKAIGDANASRAVGGALNRNPLPIVIPCHRVLAKGSLGGYAFGQISKATLLRLEGIIL